MDLTNGKHIVKEIDGVNCTVVDDVASKERVAFLTSLLEFNKKEVKSAANPSKEGEAETYTVGVTDILFNPVLAVYSKKLYTKFGRIVTPNIWNQKEKDQHIPYWSEGKEVAEVYKLELKQ